MIRRISFDLLLLFSVFALPWWMTAVVVIFSLFSFPWYYEGAVAVLAYELLYRPFGSQDFSDSTLWLTMGALLTIFIAEWLKRQLYVFR